MYQDIIDDGNNALNILSKELYKANKSINTTNSQINYYNRQPQQNYNHQSVEARDFLSYDENSYLINNQNLSNNISSTNQIISYDDLIQIDKEEFNNTFRNILISSSKSSPKKTCSQLFQNKHPDSPYIKQDYKKKPPSVPIFQRPLVSLNKQNNNKLTVQKPNVGFTINSTHYCEPSQLNSTINTTQFNSTNNTTQLNYSTSNNTLNNTHAIIMKKRAENAGLEYIQEKKEPEYKFDHSPIKSWEKMNDKKVTPIIKKNSTDDASKKYLNNINDLSMFRMKPVLSIFKEKKSKTIQKLNSAQAIEQVITYGEIPRYMTSTSNKS